MNNHPVECSILPMKFRMDGALVAATNRYLTGCHAIPGRCAARGVHAWRGVTDVSDLL